MLEPIDAKIRLRSRLVDIPRRTVLRLNARLGRYADQVIWLIGDARSGTTWVSDLINHDTHYRDMFEPIRPSRVDPTSFLTPQQYVRPGDRYPQLEVLMGDIFSGMFTHPRVDTANKRPLYGGLLVKDCFANLFARWAWLNFPSVRPVLLIRNPFAVALSKQKKPRWYWPTDPADLVSQDALMEDHLEPYRDVLTRTAADGDDIQCMLATWAVINMVPLRQFRRDELHVCFYEEIYDAPEQRLRELYDFTDPSGKRSDFRLDRATVERPSRMASERSTIVTNTSPLTTWKDELTSEQIDSGLALLTELGVGDLYGDGVVPERGVLDRLWSPSPGGVS